MLILEYKVMRLNAGYSMFLYGSSKCRLSVEGYWVTSGDCVFGLFCLLTHAQQCPEFISVQMITPGEAGEPYALPRIEMKLGL